jgi:hypothetical protein
VGMATRPIGPYSLYWTADSRARMRIGQAD